MNKRWLRLGAGLGLLLSLGCTISIPDVNSIIVPVGKTQQDFTAIDAEEAKQVRVYLKMGTGNLSIEGGGEALMEGDFIYNVEAWKPEIRYTEHDNEGRLSISQPATDKLTTARHVRYEWDVRFNEEMPLDIRIEFGSGQGDVELGSLNIRTLDMKLGVGDMEVDLHNNATLEEAEFDMGVGDLKVDLQGQWEHDVTVDIQGGVGTVTLYLPNTLGVQVDVTQGLGDVTAEGLSQRGSQYVNEAYDADKANLHVYIQAGVGEVKLLVRE